MRSLLSWVVVTAADRAAATCPWGDSGGEAASLKRSASPPDPLSRRVAGNKLDFSSQLTSPCELGAVSCKLVMVTAADRAAVTCQRWVTTNYRKRAGEGFQRAIAKPPDGLRPLVVPAGTKSRLRRRSSPPHGRGGSVSRRDLNQLAGIHTHLSGGTTYAEATTSNASRSSGGSAREGLLSEKPPPSHTPVRFHSSGGGPGEALLLEKRPPPEFPHLRL